GLGEIDDVNPVAHPEQVRLHLGVPTPGVVTEMDTRFQQLTHRKGRHRHAVSPFPVEPPRAWSPSAEASGDTGASAGMSPRRPQTRVRSGRGSKDLWARLQAPKNSMS